MLKKPVNLWIFFLVFLFLTALAVSFLMNKIKGPVFMLLALLVTPVFYFILKNIFQPRSLNDKASKLKPRN